MDNGKWSQYNFERMFEDGDNKNEKVKKRTLKLFYVCCTRAKEHLTVYFHEPSDSVLTKAKLWFGDNNVEKLIDASPQ
jgi:DNA helicase-2/ATP-dependent DNA helicase PcrA